MPPCRRRNRVQRHRRSAERALRLTEGKTTTSSAFQNAARLNAEFVAKQQAALDDAVKTLPAKALDKLPTWAKSTLTSSFGDFIPEGGAVARVGKSVLGKVPVVGTAITAAGIGYDIAQGKMRLRPLFPAYLASPRVPQLVRRSVDRLALSWERRWGRALATSSTSGVMRLPMARRRSAVPWRTAPRL